MNDECALSQSVKEEMYKCYPDAKRAHLKDGGNFPYLSRADEVNIHIQVRKTLLIVVLSWIVSTTIASRPFFQCSVTMCRGDPI